jgi:2-dehydro-3-deoxygluconokinase
VHIIDRVGGGDAFAAGLIYGMMHGFPDERAVEFASAANAYKHTVEGDFCLAGLEEISELAWGSGDGRIKR